MLDGIVGTLDRVAESLAENVEMLEMAIEEQDEEILESVVSEVDGIEAEVGKLEFQRMFRGEVDANPCYLEIQSGSGGTEAQDWAEMLLRMYLRWVERRGWKGELIEVSARLCCSDRRGRWFRVGRLFRATFAWPARRRRV